MPKRGLGDNLLLEVFTINRPLMFRHNSRFLTLLIKLSVPNSGTWLSDKSSLCPRKAPLVLEKHVRP